MIADLTPIGYVRGGRVALEGDTWSAVEARIELDAWAEELTSVYG